MEAEVLHVLQRNLAASLRRGDLEEAATILERLRLDDPLSLETRGYELEYLVRSGRLDEAWALATQLCELFPASARIRYWCGRAAFRRKAYAEAERHFTESLAVAPRPTTERWLGRTLTNLGRFEDAEARLLPLASTQPGVPLDLAWLYERMGDFDRASTQLDRHLRAHPSDPVALAQQKRLRARVLESHEITREVEDLVDFGEEVSFEMLCEYIGRLFQIGDAQKARATVRERLASLSPSEASRLGWIAYHAQAHDVAYDLFVRALPASLGNVKLLSSLEKAALSAGREEDLVQAYEAHATSAPRLHGRIHGLRRRKR
jgi:tetratricopeptide (TPR) repeat protein